MSLLNLPMPVALRLRKPRGRWRDSYRRKKHALVMALLRRI